MINILARSLYETQLPVVGGIWEVKIFIYASFNENLLYSYIKHIHLYTPHLTHRIKEKTYS